MQQFEQLVPSSECENCLARALLLFLVLFRFKHEEAVERNPLGGNINNDGDESEELQKSDFPQWILR